MRGVTLTAARRRGKAIWLETDDGDGPVLGIHLGMAGRIVVDDAEAGDPRSETERGDPRRWDRFALTFEDGGRLALRDARRLGRVRLEPDLDRVGPDAAQIGRGAFRDRVRRSSAPIKARILDQSVLAGVGNLLADEALWRARIDPRRPAQTLAVEDLDRLRRAIRAATRDAIRLGGAHTGRIVAFRAPGERCPRCGAEMQRATVGGRTTWWCPREQR
jgi:formamidopyrimidine-DNA glycosylase